MLNSVSAHPGAAISDEELESIASRHIPVMFGEVLEHLVTHPGGRYLDGTLGLGGHASEVLRKAGALEGSGARLLGLDRDIEALELAKRRLSVFGTSAHFAHCAFADFEEALDELGWDFLDGAMVDLGVSSLQLDTPERGFSFMHDGPLDMRMNASSGENAARLVNRASVEELKHIIETLGEEPQAGRIARAIDKARSVSPLQTTLELARVVEEAYPAKWRATARNHPATRTFQAIRLAVNSELLQLGQFLERIVPRLKPGGRVAVISFHSLEDRIVKHFFKTAATGCLCPPQIMQCVCGHEASLKLVTKKALVATAEESQSNTRARSAKLRVAERTDRPFSLPADTGFAGREKFKRAATHGKGKVKTPRRR